MTQKQFMELMGYNNSSSSAGSTPSASAPSSSGTSSNSAATVSTDPSNFGASDGGDWFFGTFGAKEQANRQSLLDYQQWMRNQASAKEQRDWEEYMSSTQVQRAMKDIQAAGLNPWLALQSAGFGGAVPSGAVATSSAGQASSSGANSALSSIGTSALGIAALIKVIAKLVK